MNKKPLKNVGASVRERLRNIRQQTGTDYQVLLTRYCIERFLFRLTSAGYKNQFIVKGAILFAIWQAERGHRITRDLDLLGFGDSSIEALAAIFAAVCTTPVEDDGVQFLPETVQGEPIRAEESYVGVRITLVAMIERAKIPVQVDIGFGDAQSAEPEERVFPSLLGMPETVIRAYRMETSIAEKFHVMVSLGMYNSRMKDYFDIWFMSEHFQFFGRELRGALEATFKRRDTPLPSSLPVGLTAEFWDAPEQKAAWKSFWKKSVRLNPVVELEEVASKAANFLGPLLQADLSQARWSNGRWA